jgi:hypothetical protein
VIKTTINQAVFVQVCKWKMPVVLPRLTVLQALQQIRTSLEKTGSSRPYRVSILVSSVPRGVAASSR